jgi:hypothetical protein
VYNSLILTAHCASSQAPRRRRLSRVFHGRLLHFMSISAHFRVMGVYACYGRVYPSAFSVQGAAP